MKSITINGLVFADELPTKPGWYLHIRTDEHKPWVVEAQDHTQTCVKEGELGWYPSFPGKGYWHRLVPAAWLEDAYNEGANHVYEGPIMFERSKAYERMKGELL